MFGRLLPGMLETIRPFVEHSLVWDLGAGPEVSLARVLVQTFPCKVLAIEKAQVTRSAPGVEVVRAYFDEVDPPTPGSTWPW